MSGFIEGEQGANSYNCNATAIALAKLGPAHRDVLEFLIKLEDEALPRNTINDCLHHEFNHYAETFANTKSGQSHTDVVKLLMKQADLSINQNKPENSLKSRHYIMK
jgi:hypothetical protein